MKALALALAATGCMAEVATTDSDDPSFGGDVSSAAVDGPKVLNVHYEAQTTGYWCGPTATKIALSARIPSPPSQQALADQLGTTTNGTDSIVQVVNILNQDLGISWYSAVELPNDPPTAAQKTKFWQDIVLGIDANYPLVANIVAPPSNHPPGYPNTTIYHYFTVAGYNGHTHEVFIADPADFGGHTEYWLSFDQLASLVPPKGYAAYGCGAGMTMGAIDAAYQALGGCASVLGAPATQELTTPDGAGRYNVFEHGSIYWTATTNAHEVHGAIRDAWKAAGWESGALGYPITDEATTPDGVGRYTVFEHGSIYWSPATGAHEVLGLIRDAWKTAGWEAGALGYPTSDDYAVTGGLRGDFQHGSLVWNTSTNTVTQVAP